MEIDVEKEDSSLPGEPTLHQHSDDDDNIENDKESKESDSSDDDNVKNDGKSMESDSDDSDYIGNEEESMESDSFYYDDTENNNEEMGDNGESMESDSDDSDYIGNDEESMESDSDYDDYIENDDEEMENECSRNEILDCDDDILSVSSSKNLSPQIYEVHTQDEMNLVNDLTELHNHYQHLRSLVFKKRNTKLQESKREWQEEHFIEDKMTELFNEHKEKVFEAFEQYYSQEDHPEKMSMIHDEVHRMYNEYYEQCCTPNAPYDLKTICSPEEYREATKKPRWRYVLKDKKTQESKTTVTMMKSQIFGKEVFEDTEEPSTKDDDSEASKLNNAVEGTEENVQKKVITKKHDEEPIRILDVEHMSPEEVNCEIAKTQVPSVLNDEKDTNKNVNSKLESESIFNIDNDNDEEDKSDNCEVSGNFESKSSVPLPSSEVNDSSETVVVEAADIPNKSDERTKRIMDVEHSPVQKQKSLHSLKLDASSGKHNSKVSNKKKPSVSFVEQEADDIVKTNIENDTMNKVDDNDCDYDNVDTSQVTDNQGSQLSVPFQAREVETEVYLGNFSSACIPKEFIAMQSSLKIEATAPKGTSQKVIYSLGNLLATRDCAMMNKENPMKTNIHEFGSRFPFEKFSSIIQSAEMQTLGKKLSRIMEGRFHRHGYITFPQQRT